MTTMLVLPKPPSVNGLFFNRAKGRSKTPAYEKWLVEAGWELKRQRPHHVPGAYALDIFLPPGRGDIDNYAKATSDLLVTHGVVEDDSKAARVSVETVSSITQMHCIVRPWHEVGRIADQFPFPMQTEGRK